MDEFFARLADNPAVEVGLTFVGTLLASSGFWVWINRRDERRTLNGDLLKGLAHDRILYLGLTYIKRGSVSHDEYENLYDYLYRPYAKLGGNGSAERVISIVNSLPMTGGEAHARGRLHKNNDYIERRKEGPQGTKQRVSRKTKKLKKKVS